MSVEVSAEVVYGFELPDALGNPHDWAEEHAPRLEVYGGGNYFQGDVSYVVGVRLAQTEALVAFSPEIPEEQREQVQEAAKKCKQTPRFYLLSSTS